MVMETPPSPQCVGREFVRQYYTLLNEAPAHLHRFYNNSSSFIHGGLDPPNRETTLVVGQKQIHQKIQQLNFRDCHAKITQVDSQATLGNGVVVQVTGELSNGGQPMRRFTQTFVLAFQAPKKYYVHNDIFRYQDMLTEEEYEEMTRNEIEDEQEVNHQQQAITTLSNNNANQVEDDSNDWSSQPMVNGTSEGHHHEPAPVENVQPHQPPTPAPVQQIHQSPTQPIHALPVQPPMPVVQPLPVQPQPQPQPAVDTTSHQPASPLQETTPVVLHHPSVVEQEEDPYCQIESESVTATPVNNSGETGVSEIKTYANLVKGNSSNVTNPSPTYYAPPLPQQPTSPTGGMGRTDRPKPPRESRVFTRSDENVNNLNNNETVSSVDMDRGRKLHYHDNHQLFMGNLPHYATENELREVFSRFGNIVEMRVLSKPASKGSSGKAPPNYGFIVFEQPSSVQAALSAKPIIYPDEFGTKLNVEEKKAKGIGGGLAGGRGGNRPGGLRGGGSVGRDGPARGPSRPGPPPSAPPQRHSYHRR